MPRAPAVLLSVVGWVCLAGATGCRQSAAEQGLRDDAASGKSRTAADGQEVAKSIDYCSWQRLTDQAVPVQMRILTRCSGPGPSADEFGPHFAPAIHLYANPSAVKRLQAGLFDAHSTPMPVGATIVKVKLSAPGPAEELRLLAYAAMIKREAGYDPEHGDWEYVYTTLGGEGKTERGKLSTCIECHSKAVSSDYLFGDHLQIRADEPVDRAGDGG